MRGRKSADTESNGVLVNYSVFVNMVPAGVPEIILFTILLSAAVFVAVRVARRHTFLPDLMSTADLPSLPTKLKTTIKVRRLFASQVDGTVLAEGLFGCQRLKFCVADINSNRDVYRSVVGSHATIALYALAALKSVGDLGGSDLQISPADPTAGIELMYSGPHPNDYTLRGVVAEVRNDTVDGQPVFVYQFGSAGGGLILEAAAEVTEGRTAFKVDDAVIGTARLYGYLAPEAVQGDDPEKATPRSLSAGFRR